MANVSKNYGVGDTVFVFYRNSLELFFLPQSRIVTRVRTNTAGNEAVVEFTNGNNVTDVAGTETVFTTQALCATAIVDQVITNSAASVALDATLSITSTAAQASTTLGRIG